jgi:hypothetical protein
VEQKTMQPARAMTAATDSNAPECDQRRTWVPSQRQIALVIHD